MWNKKKILAVFITAAMLLTQTTVTFAERMPAREHCHGKCRLYQSTECNL